MTQNELIQTLRGLKTLLIPEGFIIDGIFGSYARGDYTDQSDVDILYHLENPFFERYGGFIGFSKITEIKTMMTHVLNKEIDIASKNGLSKTGEKYILREMIYV